MSAEQNKIFRFHASLKTGVLPVVTAISLVLGLAGCNGCDSKPQDNMFVQNNISQDAVTVFFSKYQGNQSIVENVMRKLPEEAKKTPLRFALSELLKGPTPQEKKEGFYSEIPQGTRLLEVNIRENSVDVNLSKHFTGGGGSTSMNQRFEEVKKTVYSIDNKHQLNLSIEGKPLELLGGEGLEVQDSTKRDSQ